MKFQEVVQGNAMSEDAQGRLSAHRSTFLKDVSINPQHVVEVRAVPSRIVEGYGDKAIQLSKIVTTIGEVIVIGSQKEIDKKIFGDMKRVLKG